METRSNTGKRQREEEISLQKTKRARQLKQLRNEIMDSKIYAIGDEIHFNGAIDQDSIETIIKEISLNLHLFYTNHKEKEPHEIKYIVDSPGGSVKDVLKFVDFISLTKKKYPNLKYTSIITGRAASAGTTMSIIADERLITKYSSAMIHELSTQSGYKSYTHHNSYNKYIDDLDNVLMGIYLKNQKVDNSEAHLRTLLQKETWMSAEEYLKLGFVDRII